MAYTEGSWKLALRRLRSLHGITAAPPNPRPFELEPRALYSDKLFDPHFLQYLPLPEGCLAPQSQTVASRDAASFSVEAFQREFDRPGKPVVIRGGCAEWPATKTWSRAYLEAQAGNKTFQVSGRKFRFADFLDYAMKNADEEPMYAPVVRVFVCHRLIPYCV